MNYIALLVLVAFLVISFMNGIAIVAIQERVGGWWALLAFVLAAASASWFAVLALRAL